MLEVDTISSWRKGMAKRIATRSFEGAHADIYFWNDRPDGMPEAESNFYTGYLEVFIFGTGEIPQIGMNWWRMFYVWPRYDMVVSDTSQALVPIDEACAYGDIEMGLATLRGGPEAPRHPIVTIDFELQDGDIIKKIVLLKQDGSSVEIPDETMH